MENINFVRKYLIRIANIIYNNYSDQLLNNYANILPKHRIQVGGGELDDAIAQLDAAITSLTQEPQPQVQTQPAILPDDLVAQMAQTAENATVLTAFLGEIIDKTRDITLTQKLVKLKNDIAGVVTDINYYLGDGTNAQTPPP